ncbi:MAG TPA: alpha/beta family hydrolase [Candidatus Krumholzibacteria bacterium]|nr:alpha/beta family hydrolase [Candidatus Krumholzibacteria bacterium]
MHVSDGAGDVSALIATPRDAWAAFVFAHGAGANMHHKFLEETSAVLFDAGVATFRYNFPYMEGRRQGRPDSPARLELTVEAAVREAKAEFGELPLFAGGKSLGGRMTSQAASRSELPGVRGLIFLGFPLHPHKSPSTARAAHLDRVNLPMLFVQGTRDNLADITLMRAMCSSLGSRATLHIIDHGDHSLAVLKHAGRTAVDVMKELCDAITTWMRRVLEGAK